MARLGKDRNPYRAGFLQFVGVAETREKAFELYKRAGRVLLRPLPARRSALCATPPGYVTEATQRAGIVSRSAAPPAAARGAKARGDAEMDEIVEHGYVIIGSPDEVVEQLPRSRPSSMSGT